MNTTSRIAATLLAATLGACAFVPKTNLRLEEARSANREARADLRVATFAKGELQKAEEAFERAQAASSTLDDPAVVDHLAYVAKQRFAIARAAARAGAADHELRLQPRANAVSIR